MTLETTTRRIPLAFLVGAMILTSGCGKKTTIINQAPAAPTTSVGGSTLTSTVVAPEGETTPEQAKELLEAAYKEGYEQGFNGTLAELPEVDRSERRKRRLARHRRRVRRMREIRRQEIAKILDEKYASRFDELVAEWEAANPGQKFTCDDEPEVASPIAKVEDDEVEAADASGSAEADEDETADASGSTDDEADEEADAGTTDDDPEPAKGKSAGNLACWRKLCPAIDDLIRARPGFGGHGGYKQGFKQGFQAGKKAAAEDDDGWMGAAEGEDQLGDIDVSDLGVELPTENITQEALQPLLDQARTNGETAGKEAATEANDERTQAMEDRKAERLERLKEREEAFRRRLRQRLPEQVAEAADDCEVESNGKCEKTEEEVIPTEDTTDVDPATAAVEADPLNVSP